MKRLRFGQLHTAMVTHGYRFFNRGDYNLNIIGVRSADTHSNEFNDRICFAYYVNNMPMLHIFEATTDPGVYWRENLANVDGTAIVVPGQYPNLWKIGKHQGRYTALKQHRKISVYRDSNLDGKIDTNVAIDTGMFGINMHHASVNTISQNVDRWSAGCQVLANRVDFDISIALCKKSAEIHGNGFTYTLLDEASIL